MRRRARRVATPALLAILRRMISHARWLAFACALTMPGAAVAQIVDVQSRFSIEPKPGLHGALQGSADWRTGNTEYLSVRGTGSVSWRFDRHLMLALVLAEHGVSNGQVTLAHLFEHLRYRFHWTALLRPEAFGQHEIDYFRRLQLRALLGAGLRLVAFEGKDRLLAFGAALMLEREVLRNDGLPDAGQATSDVRVSSYALLRVGLMENVNLVETVYVQPRVDRPSDLKLLEETTLQLKVNALLAVNVAFNLDWDTAPPATVKPLDTQVVSSLVLSF